MNSSATDHDWGYCSWLPSELDQVVATLSREFPQKTQGEIVHAVVFCKGAVQRNQGFHALQTFVSRLLQTTPAISLQRSRSPFAMPSTPVAQ